MIALAVIAALSSAPDPQPPTPDGTPPVTPALAQTSLEQSRTNPDRVVCRREAATGTRFVKRTCRTQREWDEITEKSQQSFREVQNRPMTQLGGN